MLLLAGACSRDYWRCILFMYPPGYVQQYIFVLLSRKFSAYYLGRQVSKEGKLGKLYCIVLYLLNNCTSRAALDVRAPNYRICAQRTRWTILQTKHSRINALYLFTYKLSTHSNLLPAKVEPQSKHDGIQKVLDVKREHGKK